mgnify:CR=1 FL=1
MKDFYIVLPSNVPINDDETNKIILEAITQPSKAVMSATAPTSPADGAFWFDTDEYRSGTTRALKVWNALGSVWEYVSSDLSLSTTNVWTAKNTFNQGVIIGLSSAPSSPTLGQIYYDTTLQNLRVWNGSQWSSITGGGGGSAFQLISTDTTQVPAIMFFGASAPASGISPFLNRLRAAATTSSACNRPTLR